jgi:hypothetical protein
MPALALLRLRTVQRFKVFLMQKAGTKTILFSTQRRPTLVTQANADVILSQHFPI